MPPMQGFKSNSISPFPQSDSSRVVEFDTIREAYAALNAGELAADTVARVSWEADAYTDAGYTEARVNASGEFVTGLLDVSTGVPLSVLGASWGVDAGDTIPTTAEGYPQADTDNLTQFSALKTEDFKIESPEVIDLWMDAQIPTILFTGPSNSLCGVITYSGAQVRYLYIQTASSASSPTVVMNSPSTFTVGGVVQPGGTDFLDDRVLRWRFQSDYVQDAQPDCRGEVQSVDPVDARESLQISWEASEGDWTADPGPLLSVGVYAYNSAVAGSGVLTWTRIRVRGRNVQFT